ncbi:PR domain zinc finger protein 5-like [Venturia canescens]|uniref:PR domain zinc finger protein 5-like n=1 Tax=Venturia canescens TaxID=32260 RepID=UPI001C9C8A05|nr:PR domain zinc finger protein 5-like [Venturia canescens]
MSGQQEILNPSFLSYEINGSQFIVQSLENTQELTAQLGSIESEESILKLVDREVKNEENEESIPLVCVDGQIYAIHNGELQALDIGQLEYENEPSIQEDKESLMEVTKSLEPEGSPVEIEQLENLDDSQICSDEELVIEEDNKQLYVVAKDNLNANDFVEVVTAFKCKICPYTTQDRKQLFKHFQNIHANPVTKVQDENENSEEVKLVYMCGECSNCFPSMEACREHMIKDHQLTDRVSSKTDKKQIESPKKTNQPSFKPSILGARRPKSPTLQENVASKNPSAQSAQQNKKALDLKDREVKCTYRGCPYKFSTDITMQQHAVCHIDVPYCSNIFKCNICKDVKFTKWRSCSLHLWKKHQIDVDLFQCNICKAYKSATMVKLLTHMRVHSENREFECPDCGKRFKQSSQLRNHRVMHLDRKSSDVPRWYTSKTCDLCGKTYADSKCLKNHIQAVHSKLRPYVCNVCGHSSARKAMLQLHLRQHTGDKPFNCQLCDYKTGDHNSLRRHMMRHTGVRPYKCPHCPYSAIQSNSYKNHLRAKHPLLSGLFTCELCPFKTVKNESYLQHIADHQKGLIKTPPPKKDGENVEVFPGNIAAAQLIYSCLGAFSKVGKTIEASLMSSSTSADGTSQTITIQIPSKHLEGSLPISDNTTKTNSSIEQDDDETMHCFLKIPREEEENIDTGGITIPADPEVDTATRISVDS